MTILRVGTNQQYSDNWDSIFGGKKRKSTKKAVAKKATKKKAAKKKSTKKKKR